MGRRVGSKNKNTLELEALQQKIYELENSKQFNTYNEVVSAFVDGFIMDIQNSIKTVNLDTLQTWFNNPDDYMEDISNLLTYHYIIDGNIFQLYDLIFSLPDLSYKITAFEKTPTYAQDIAKIKQVLERKVKHKQLTRDLLVQLAHDGTLLGTWLGGSKEPYYYAFNNLEYIFPYGRSRGDMVGVIDLKWLDAMKDEEKINVYNNLKPLVTENLYKKWKNCNDPIKKKEYQYVVLPTDKSLVARVHTLNRNQRLGIPFGTQALFDIEHKQKMKELERSIADKIIRAIAVLKFKGKDDNDVKVKESHKKQVFSKVKKAMEMNNGSSKNGLTVIGIPDFADLSYPEFKNGDKILTPDKYESADYDITNSTGISPVLTNGTKGNYSSAKLNLDIIYKKIGVILESIEEIYNQLIVMILGEKKGYNYQFVYNKETPLEKTKKIDNLMKLQAQGYSSAYVLDEMGIDPEEYFKQSIYEIETLDLRNRIKPPLSTYTATSSDVGGAPTLDNPTNENTIQSTEINAGGTPKPSNE